MRCPHGGSHQKAPPCKCLPQSTDQDVIPWPIPAARGSSKGRTDTRGAGPLAANKITPVREDDRGRARRQALTPGQACVPPLCLSRVGHAANPSRGVFTEQRFSV